MDILQKLRDAQADTKRDMKRTDLRTKDILLLSDMADVFGECGDEIESLRRQLAECEKLKELYREASHEKGKWIRNHATQLTECEKERDNFKEAVSSYMKAYDDCREEHTTTHAKLVALEEETAPMTLKFRTAIEQMEKLDPVAWELRKGKTDHVLIDITNNKTVAMNWKCSLEEVVPLYDLRGIKE